MNSFIRLVYSDYLQRTRSYIFLIVLAVSLYAAYLFVPTPDAKYTTVRIGNYIGMATSAWNGYVTAMMTSVFLSVIGFYLINSNIKKDINTGVGMIIAASGMSNLKYMLYKMCSNFLVLLTITGIIAMMSAAVYLYRSNGQAFEIGHFTIPFILITLPSMFVVASVAVLAESYLYRYSILMNVAYYFLFMFLLAPQGTINPLFDVLGIKNATLAMQDLVGQQYHTNNVNVNMGFMIGHKDQLKQFRFEGLQWSGLYLLSRLIWMAGAMALVYLSAAFFHRFDFAAVAKKSKSVAVPAESYPLSNDIKLSALPAIDISYRLWPILKTELIMLYRKGPAWLWLLNLGAMIAMAIVPLAIGHQYILPALWFFQVARLSDISTKERTFRVHYFSYVSYQPLSRLFTAQVLSAVIVLVALAMPLMLRYIIKLDFAAVAAILLGALMIVMAAVVFGLLTGGKKLFEIVFFMLTYSNLNKIPILDYFGAVNMDSNYLYYITAIAIGLSLAAYLIKKAEIRML